MVWSRLNSSRSRSTRSDSMSARWGWSRSMLRYNADSDRVSKSVPSSSPSAVRRIHAGMACSEAGAIRRFITIAQVSTRVRSLRPAVCNASSNPMRFQNDRPTWTVPASRTDSTATLSGSMAMVHRGERGRRAPGAERRRGARVRALSRSSATSGGSSNRVCWPARAACMRRAILSHCSRGLGERSPSEQMVFWRGPLGVEMDSTSR